MSNEEIEKFKNELKDLHIEFLRSLNKELLEKIKHLIKAGDELERVLVNHLSSYEVGNASHEWKSAKNYKPPTQ